MTTADMSRSIAYCRVQDRDMILELDSPGFNFTFAGIFTKSEDFP